MNATIRLGLSSVFMMLAGGLAAYAPAASAQATTLKNAGNGRCLATNAASGAAVTQVCNGAAINPQLWTQTNTGSGFLIKNTVTGRCLDNNTTGNVFTSPCNSTIASQRWLRLNSSSPAAVRFRSVGTQRYLDNTAAGAVFSNLALGGTLQIWAF
jgi:Ricin-type beta-trefoil lectin domain